MMLPFRRRPTPPQPSSKTSTVKKTPTVSAAESLPAVAEPASQHLDYDLQPLNVESLSHYIEPVVDEERFRVH